MSPRRRESGIGPGPKLALCFALLVPALCCAQTMYKWVDEKGVTHFSENPPPDGKKASNYEAKVTGPSDPSAKPADWKRRELENKGSKAEKNERDRATRAAEEDARNAKYARCTHAQTQVRVLSTPRPVYSTNSKGERVYVEDTDREARLKEARRYADDVCR